MDKKILDCFNIYKESIFKIDSDLGFWNYFLKSSIDDYSKSSDRELNTAIFCAYDLQHDKIGGGKKCHEKVYRIMSSELDHKRIDFFHWIMNLSILKAYNALELLIYQAISITYFPDIPNPILSKKNNDKIQNRVLEFLRSNSIPVNTRNNEHLITFLCEKSPKLRSFVHLPMNVDLKTTWINFFYLISLIRNIVAHCGMIVQRDTLNEIKSKAKDIFERHFEIIKDEKGLPILTPRNEVFGNFIDNINSLSIGIYKYVFNENDLTFIELK
jgi:hypothetical protein